MKIKVSDYVAQFLVKQEIEVVFTVVGGGAMHLNNSFGHCEELQCIYNHHEQASSIAAEAYERIAGKMAVVCVTSGPGAINALNGVAGAYLDSIPMLIISGQSKSSLIAKYSGLNIRSLGIQDFDTITAVAGMTKYAETIMCANKIRYCLEKAFFYAKSGRPGPVWLEIPVDIQGTFVEEEMLESFTPLLSICDVDSNADLEKAIGELVEHIKFAKRPVIYAGNGIRISGAEFEFKHLVNELQIPVVTCWNSIDLIETDNRLYAGRGGTMGDRAGNFAIQNSDLLLVIGSRLSINQVGYDVRTWAREAFVAMVDIDSEEMKKDTIHVELPICCDAKDFILQLLEEIKNIEVGNFGEWVSRCQLWKKKYPVVSKKHYEDNQPINVYAFMDCLSRNLDGNAITVVANGSASVVGSQSYYIKSNQRFIMNCGLSSMGYDLPAAIGSSIANDRKKVVCVAGDGSIQMNLQELQTIVTNQLPIKVFIINNGGYHQIRLTQKNIFHNSFVGVGPESNDLGFPDFSKVADAYGMRFFKIENVEKLETVIKQVLSWESFCICEVMCTINQAFEPKSSTKRLEDGTLVSPPLEDMAPFLSREELQSNMYI